MSKQKITLLVLLLSFILAACGEKPSSAPKAVQTKTAAATSTPDPCSSGNLPDEVKKIHDLTREFDDYATLASNTPQAQIIQLIPEMQRILRDAQDQSAPACLQELKKLQLINMTIVVQTLVAFLGTTDKTSAEQINTGIIQAREMHMKYDVERARLLGVTLEALSTLPSDSAAPDATAIPITATNPGSSGINLRSAPDLNSPQAGTLGAQSVTTAYGRTPNNEWIQVDVPDKLDQKAWVAASLISLSDSISKLPIINP